MPTDKSVPPSMSSTIINPLTDNMPALDRAGRIAYVEEQGAGSTKVSSLYSIRPDGSDRQLIDELSGYIYAPAWSTDGQLLAYSKQAPRQNPRIYIYDVSSQTHNLVVDTEGSNLSPSFSPDGQKLLYSSTVGGDADIYEMHLNSGKTKQLTTLPSTEVQPSYASDGQSFVYTSDKKNAGRPRIYRYDFATRNATQITKKDYAASPQLSRDGKHLAYLNDRQAAIMSLATGKTVKLAETGIDEPARFSPSGQYTVYPTRTSRVDGQSGGSIVIHSLAGRTSYAISSKTGGVVRSPIWSQ
ncbi:Xaa-Pro aminopeptidase [Psychrobacter sp. ENNN9_III]|uniref:Xaa-Pro aminopeptidase n=1 Tax=Psychrobacter sp. ENNN9_III TaxID=1254334 RepID=UPI001D0D0A3C|nr:Xaa-Pro aminopeptidase [Psychrobacter sp. ENNN9_III]